MASRSIVQWTLGCVVAAGSVGGGCRARAVDRSGTTEIPAGRFWQGSDLDERAHSLEVSFAAHGGVIPDPVAWLEAEHPRRKAKTAAFSIMTAPVTQRDYLVYTRRTGAPEPWVDPVTWSRYQTGIDYAAVHKVAWRRGKPPTQRMDHPVVLVSQHEAAAFCAWWGAARGGLGTLPTEAQWEKAARGTDGRAYPWGDRFDSARLNAIEAKRGDTSAVGTYAESASPYGVHDMAGNVFEWTRSKAGAGRYVLKGGAYNADGAVARAAARHARPGEIRHVAVGFRCVLLGV